MKIEHVSVVKGWCCNAFEVYGKKELSPKRIEPPCGYGLLNKRTGLFFYHCPFCGKKIELEAN